MCVSLCECLCISVVGVVLLVCVSANSAFECVSEVFLCECVFM